MRKKIGSDSLEAYQCIHLDRLTKSSLLSIVTNVLTNIGTANDGDFRQEGIWYLQFSLAPLRSLREGEGTINTIRRVFALGSRPRSTSL